MPQQAASAWQHDGRTIWLVANLLPQAQEIRVDGQKLTLPPRRIRVVEP